MRSVKLLFAAIFIFIFHAQLCAQDSLNFSRLQDLMLQHNPLLKSDGIGLEIAINEHLAGKNLRLPDLNGNVTCALSDGRSLDPVTYRYYQESFLNNTYRFQSNMVLYQGGRTNATIDKYQIKVEGQKEKIRNSTIQLQQDLLTQYVEACMLNELMKIWRNNIDNLKQLKELTALLVKSGKATGASTANIDIEINKYTQYLDNIIYRYEASTLRIKNLIGYKFDQPLYLSYNIKDFKPNGIIYSDEEIEAIALNSPVYKMAESNTSYLQQEHRIANSYRYPTVVLGGSIGTGYSSVFQNTALMSTDWQSQMKNNRYQMLSVSLVIPVFNRFQYSSAAQRSQLNYFQALEIEKKEKATITEWLHVQNRHLSHYNSNYTYGVNSMELYNSVITESNNNYKAGKISLIEYLLIQQQKALLEENNIILKYNFLATKKSIELYQWGSIDLNKL